MELMQMLIDYPTEWEHFMISGKIRTFSKSTPKQIVEKAKEINKTAIRTGGKPAFFFESTEENDGQELINNMLKGDIAAIKKGIASDSILLKIDAIVCAVKNKISEKEVINKIISLKNDTRYLRSVAFTVGEFAIAGLHLLGIESYEGENPSIKRLIESKFDF